MNYIWLFKAALSRLRAIADAASSWRTNLLIFFFGLKFCTRPRFSSKRIVRGAKSDLVPHAGQPGACRRLPRSLSPPVGEDPSGGAQWERSCGRYRGPRIPGREKRCHAWGGGAFPRPGLTPGALSTRDRSGQKSWSQTPGLIHGNRTHPL